MRGDGIVRRAPFGENPTVGERGAGTQRRILEAALATFGVHGFHETRVELITEAAGCSRPAFYQYFSSKEDVFWRLAGLFGRDMADLAGALGDVSRDTPGVDVLVAWLDDLIQLCGTYSPVLAAYDTAAREAPIGVTPASPLTAAIARQLVRSSGSTRRSRRIDDLATTAVTTVLRTIHYAGLGLGGVTRAELARGLAATLHRLLHGGVDAVNRPPSVGRPPNRAPAWPTFPEVGDRQMPMRPRGIRTRRALLEAGSRVLPRRGYHEARVDDIVAEAGVSHGSFYRYFEDKADLFHVLVEDAAHQMVELVTSFPTDVDDDGLHRWLRTWFKSYRANGGVISAWQEIDFDEPALAAYSLEVAVVAFDRLCRIVHARGFGSTDVDALALLALVERVPYRVLTDPALDEAAFIEAAATFVRRAIFGYPEA